MEKHQLFIRKIVLILFAILGFAVQAGTQPKFSIIQILAPAATINVGGQTNAGYLVTNNTKTTRQLIMVGIPGIVQIVGVANACPLQFTLHPGQSCVLALTIFGNQKGANYGSGPVICKTLFSDNTQPDPFLCSQPSLQDIISVRVV